MNWLAHLRLAPPEPLLRIGNLCGDFVRGVDIATLPEPVRRGIQQHRAVDRFVDAHPVVRISRARLAPPFRRLAPVLVDVFYDHFLARDWERFGDGRPLRVFVDEVHAALDANADSLPPRLRGAVPTMREQDWLASYADLGGIDAILGRMSRRLSRETPLGSGGLELRRSYDALAMDFAAFWPQLEVQAQAIMTA